MKNLFSCLLIFVMIFAFQTNVFASAFEETQYSDIDSFDYLEYEVQHMQEHRNAEIANQFNRGILIVGSVALVVNSIVFSIMSKKQDKLFSKYLIVLACFLVVYITLHIFVAYRYSSPWSINPIDQHMLVGMMALGVLPGVFAKSNKSRLLVSSVPAVVAMLLFVIFGFEMEHFLEDLGFAVCYSAVIEIPTQIVLCPIYLMKKKKQI